MSFTNVGGEGVYSFPLASPVLTPILKTRALATPGLSDCFGMLLPWSRVAKYSCRAFSKLLFSWIWDKWTCMLNFCLHHQPALLCTINLLYLSFIENSWHTRCGMLPNWFQLKLWVLKTSTRGNQVSLFVQTLKTTWLSSLWLFVRCGVLKKRMHHTGNYCLQSPLGTIILVGEIFYEQHLKSI